MDYKQDNLESTGNTAKKERDQKEDKRRKIREVLKQKLSISNITDVNLGRRLSFNDNFGDEHSNDYNSQEFRFSDIYKFKGIVGQGQYGVVILVNKVDTGERRALKIVHKTRLSEEETEYIKFESEILSKFQQKPNVVQSSEVIILTLNLMSIKQMFESSYHIFLEMEYIAGGQLKKIYDKRHNLFKQTEYYKNQQNIIKQQIESQDEDTIQNNLENLKELEHCIIPQEPIFNDEEASQILKGIINGLVYIHELDIIHRDLKPENIMLTNNDQIKSEYIKIVDFGLSAKFKATQKSILDDKVGTLLFMAPEQISNQNYGKKIDMYACGIILYYLLIGKHPIFQYGDTQVSYKHKVNSMEPEKWFYPHYVSKLAQDFISRVCRISALQRFDAKRALTHPWITRKFEDKIPLTRTEEMLQYNVQQMLSKLIKLATFLQIVKTHNDAKSAPDASTLQSSIISVKQFSPKKKLDTSYIQTLKEDFVLTETQQNITTENNNDSFIYHSFMDTQNFSKASLENQFPSIYNSGRQQSIEESKEFMIRKRKNKKPLENTSLTKTKHQDLQANFQQNLNAQSEASSPNIKVGNRKLVHILPLDKTKQRRAVNYQFTQFSSKKSQNEGRLYQQYSQEDDQEFFFKDSNYSSKKQNTQLAIPQTKIQRPSIYSYSNPYQEEIRLGSSISPDISPSERISMKSESITTSAHTVSQGQFQHISSSIQKQPASIQPNQLSIKLSKCSDQKLPSPFGRTQVLQDRYSQSKEKHEQIVETISMPPIQNNQQNQKNMKLASRNRNVEGHHHATKDYHSNKRKNISENNIVSKSNDLYDSVFKYMQKGDKKAVIGGVGMNYVDLNRQNKGYQFKLSYKKQ